MLSTRISGKPLSNVLLNPRSIALVGASDDPRKTASRPLQYLRRTGYAGRVYPINPNKATVLGEAAWPSLSALPEIPESVFLLASTSAVIPTVQECIRLGVKVVTVLASGFSESGPEGVQREHELRDLVQGSSIRLLGPSSIGIVNPRNGLMLTANAAFAEPDLPVGRVFVASHSGSMIGALVSRGKARGVGFAGLVSVGSEVDLSLGEICSSTLDDPGVDGYLLFLESLHCGEDLRRFAIDAAKRGKPVIAYKLGRSDAAAEMVTTHTGAIAGEDDIADAFLKDCGVARVGILDALLETFPLAQRLALGEPSRQRRVGVVTTTGGGAAMVVDQLGLRGIEVQAPSVQTLQRLRERGIEVAAGRAVDLTLAGVNYEVMKTALDVLLEAPEFDLVVATIGSSARFQPQLAVKPIIDSLDNHRTPLAAMLVPDAPEALAALTAQGVPCFRSPEACADAIAAVFFRRTPATFRSHSSAAADARALSEAEAYRLLKQLGVPCAAFVTSALDGPPPDLAFDYPVVAKVCSAHIPHKTEVGGVLLGIRDEIGLAQAMATLRGNLAIRAPNVPCDQILVQKSVAGLAEVLVGYRVDPDAGPIVILAAGGIWAEVARDRSIRLAPVSVDTAREMVSEVKSLKTLTGLRGRPRGDLEALAQAVCALSQLALRPEMQVREAEVNPLMVLPEGQGVLAADALVWQA